MGVRHAEQETIERLEAKTLDAQLRQILVAGLACSPFEAEAVLEAVQEVYAPFFHGPDAAAAQPGQVTLVALAAEEPAGSSNTCGSRNSTDIARMLSKLRSGLRCRSTCW